MKQQASPRRSSVRASSGAAMPVVGRGVFTVDALGVVVTLAAEATRSERTS